MQARALALALRLLTVACAGAALGGLTGCPFFFNCPDAWSEPDPLDFGTDVDLINVGPGIDYDSYVAVGLGGLVSSFDGESATVQSPVNVALRAVTRHDTRLIAVGDQGVIVISDDAGQTWSTRTSGTTGSLIAVLAAQPGGVDVLIAVGVESIVVSTDGGETWAVVMAPATGWGTLRGVFASTERIYAVGDAGVAWSSNTPATLWTAEVLGTTADLLGGGGQYEEPSYVPTEADPLLIAAADNTVLVRDSSGWKTVTLEIDGDLLGISGGYLLTSTGAVYDLDGTGIASRLPIGFDFPVKAILADAGGVLVVGGQGQAARAYYQPCIGGRPLVDEGERVVASLVEREDWLVPTSTLDSFDPEAAASWASAGLDEHASVGSFAVHVLELVSLGAPAELVREAQQAMADEVRHAKLSFGLAVRFGAVARGPGPISITPTMSSRCGDILAIALALLEQGCVNETLAACEASVAAQTCADPEARRVLDVIASDERRHAALAWKTLRWLIDHDPDLCNPLRRRLTRLAATQTSSAVAGQTLRELILPLARTLLAAEQGAVAPV